MRIDELYYQVTDSRPGWKLGARVIPTGFKIGVNRYTRVDGEVDAFDPHPHIDLTDEEAAALKAGERDFLSPGWIPSLRLLLELEVESDSNTPPRCVALRAPQGISTVEQRLPLAGLVAQAAAYLASETGNWDLVKGQRLDYLYKTREQREDDLFEARRKLGKHRKRRQPVTAERLAQVLQVARSDPAQPTKAVQDVFGFARGYAFRLIRRAEAAEAAGTLD